MDGEAKPLTQQVAIVTGSTRGIGRAIAHKLAQPGAKVVVSGRQTRGVERTARELTALIGC